jgi:hypothetical protein
LIIGYDEDPGSIQSGAVRNFPPLEPGDRGGSHNLVIGRGHRFTQAAFAGFVAGKVNVIANEEASVSGGEVNTASGGQSSVSGGSSNTASGAQASVTGGADNFASGLWASVSGGVGNTAGGTSTVVLGGTNVTDNKGNSIAPQPPFP